MTYRAGQPPYTPVSDDDLILWAQNEFVRIGGAFAVLEQSGSPGGATDHGALTGLGDDDHTQYHTDARGDARYSQLGHTHPQSDITGLVGDLTAVNALAGDAYTDANDALLAAAAAQATADAAQAAAVAAQSDADAALAALPGKSDVGHTHVAANISDFAEAVDDRVVTLLIAGANISLTYNDPANTLTVSVTGLITDHGALTGLADDDHPQYHTDARGDARYSLLGHTHAYLPLTGGTLAGPLTVTLGQLTLDRTGEGAQASIITRSDSGFGSNHRMDVNGVVRAFNGLTSTADLWGITQYDAAGLNGQTNLQSTYGGALVMRYGGSSTKRTETTATGLKSFGDMDAVDGLKENGVAISALYAAISHTHTSASITDFAEAVDDRVAALLVAGSGVSLTYNDPANTITVTATGGPGGASATTVEANLGATALCCGRFTITDAAISASSKVMAWQAPGPYTGKGTRADEAEMQPVSVIAVVPGSGSAVVHWQTPPAYVCVPQMRAGPRDPAGATFDRLANQMQPVIDIQRRGKVRGNVKFSYMVLA